MYECPDNANIGDEDFADTNALIQEAVAATEEDKVLYLRGLIPKDLVEVDEPAIPDEAASLLYLQMREGPICSLAQRWRA